MYVCQYSNHGESRDLCMCVSIVTMGRAGKNSSCLEVNIKEKERFDSCL